VQLMTEQAEAAQAGDGDRVPAVTGDLDSTDIFAVAALVDRKAPHARRARVPGAAHMVNLEQPARFDGLLREFLHAR
jgi:3-oxoadipate enol-lactonase